jgi:hemerythrin
MTKTRIMDGVYYLEAPEARLSLLCGCPENAVKFLIKDGLVRAVEKEGYSFETGPNAILLSELPVQGGRFCNLAEFPVLQMLYRQGMMVPGHPNNTGLRPMIIGMREQVEAQGRYIYLGNYGLGTAAELEGGGIGPAEAAELLRMKLKFAFGRRRSSEEFLDLRCIDGNVIPLRDGAFLRRQGVNRYELICCGESAEVDLNLGPGSSYAAPYSLPLRPASREDFAVVHIGEGDGWDVARPCMSSVVVWRGEPYLVDAGPNIEESLAAVGLAVADLKGLFQTHVHDDHFVGMCALLRAERRLPYYAVPCVRRSAEAKLRALAKLETGEFERYFQVRELEAGAWNEVDGLSVLPLVSPHPLETTIFRFRARFPGGQRTYAHYADLTSFAVLDSMVADDPGAPGISREFARLAKAEYLDAADLKKVDVGGGMIHGDAADFERDASGLLLLSHTSPPLSGRMPAFGSVAEFGDETVLIPSTADYASARGAEFLRAYFPTAPKGELALLARGLRSSPLEGELLIRSGEVPSAVLLVLSGLAASRGSEGGPGRLYSAGSLLGATEARKGQASAREYRARAGLELLAVSGEAYRGFLERRGLSPAAERIEAALAVMEAFPLFAGMSSMATLHAVAAGSAPTRIAEGEGLGRAQEAALYVLLEGRAEIRAGTRSIEEIGPGGFFGEERILYEGDCIFVAAATASCLAYRIPSELLLGSPLLLWRLREALARRLALARNAFTFDWRDEYSVGVEELDEQHRGIFSAIDELARRLAAGGEGAIEALAEIGARASRHYAIEESRMALWAYPGLEAHARAHAEILAEVGGFESRLAAPGARAGMDARAGIDARVGIDASEITDYMKDCLLRHTLLVDRLYMPFVKPATR